MSLLAPLYFLGLAAVSLPILFHLIRRTPRGRQQFSSLMFLTPSPPRLTRRSRIENWLLLLLRAAALILLATAFARPFLRQVANLSLDGVRGRRVAILLDTSASMQRDGVWQLAIAKLNSTLNKLDAADEVALYTFDGDVNAMVPFAGQASMHLEKSTQEVVRQKAAELSPSWRHSDLGTALVTIAEELTLSTDEANTLAVAQIMVISDMQQGADLKAVQGYEWPEEVRVSIESIEPADPSNGTLSLLRTEDEAESTDTVRVRVANSADSSVDQYHVGWAVPTKTDADADSGHSRSTRQSRSTFLRGKVASSNCRERTIRNLAIAWSWWATRHFSTTSFMSCRKCRTKSSWYISAATSRTTLRAYSTTCTSR